MDRRARDHRDALACRESNSKQSPARAARLPSLPKFVTVVRSVTLTQSRHESLSLTVVFSVVVIGKETVAPSLTFVGGESTLVDVFILVGVESHTAVESVLHSAVFVSVEMPLYLTRVSYVNLAIASHVAMIADGHGTSMIIGGLGGITVVISLISGLFLYVRCISKFSEMELSAQGTIEPLAIKSKTLRLSGESTQSQSSHFAALAENQLLELEDSQTPFSNCLSQDLTVFLPRSVTD
jgi:hypothetical protein